MRTGGIEIDSTDVLNLEMAASNIRKLALRRKTPSYLDLLGKSRCN
jgi:hypothetical protein